MWLGFIVVLLFILSSAIRLKRNINDIKTKKGFTLINKLGVLFEIIILAGSITIFFVIIFYLAQGFS
jgi:hypothetical protein